MQASINMHMFFFTLCIAFLAAGANAARLLRSDDDMRIMSADQFTRFVAPKDPRKTNAVAYSMENLAGARDTGKSSGMYLNRGQITNAGELYPGPRGTTVVERSSKSTGAVSSSGVINFGRSSIAADIDGKVQAQANSQGMGAQSSTERVSGASSTGLYKPSKVQTSGVATSLKGATASAWSGLAGGAGVASNAGDAVAFAIAGGDNGR